MYLNDHWPKTLIIRNTTNGLIWEAYDVNNIEEAKMLAKTSKMNRFLSRTLEERGYCSGGETFDDWRNHEEWVKRWENKESELEIIRQFEEWLTTLNT